ncbi:hypothetical protein BH23ACT5_BH23ACT5_08370 [soil metagenome]
MRRIELPPAPSSPSQAREFLRDSFDAWGIAGDAKEDGALLVTEMVTNAIIHAKTAVVVEVSKSGHVVEVAVSDSGGGAVRLQDPRPDSVTGRGLRLVDRLASEWSVTDRAGGKTVRFSLDVNGAKAGL